MKSYRQGVRQLHQMPGSRHIDMRVLIQHSQDDAIRAQFVCIPDVLLHDLELVVGVGKVSAAWANHHEHSDPNAAANQGN
jgi:hypothetical protein